MRGDRLRLQDILDAIEVITEYAAVTRQEFDANPPVKSHILFHIQVIGEAVSKLSQDVRDLDPQVPWQSIARMRNVIAHVYFGIDWDEVWQVARNDVPSLKPRIQVLLAALPPEHT
jgi:uncharacterized protein with HEPN domain